MDPPHYRPLRLTTALLDEIVFTSKSAQFLSLPHGKRQGIKTQLILPLALEWMGHRAHPA
jgi:hypothetical protein